MNDEYYYCLKLNALKNLASATPPAGSELESHLFDGVYRFKPVSGMF